MPRHSFIRDNQEETREFPNMADAAEYALENRYSVIIKAQGEE